MKSNGFYKIKLYCLASILFIAHSSLATEVTNKLKRVALLSSPLYNYTTSMNCTLVSTYYYFGKFIISLGLLCNE